MKAEFKEKFAIILCCFVLAIWFIVCLFASFNPKGEPNAHNLNDLNPEWTEEYFKHH